MAPTMHALCTIALRTTYRIRPRRPVNPVFTTISQFHSSSLQSYSDTLSPYSFRGSLSQSSRTFYDSLSPDDRLRYEQDAIKLDEHMTSPAVEARLNAEVAQEAYDALLRAPRERPDVEDDKFKPGLMSMGEIDEIDSGEDETFEGDDISSLAHGELEQHRELREYARIAAWEMPLLSKLTTPFQPPTTSNPTPLRFRYTSYLGETHPAGLKVVLEFSPVDLPLAPSQRLTLIKLVGPRYDPQLDLVRMSCEMFETQAQNKRYLGDLVDTLMQEAREGEDKFEDMAVDFRHVKWRERKLFPEGWKLSGERKQELEARRGEREQKERERLQLGKIVDGVKVIEAAVRAANEEEKVQLPSTFGRKVGLTAGKGRQRAMQR
ncbi:37S ribosomal protein S24, mitochondrial [Lambiella insularis]|nr:37S ribosomal protein S24, mitochondrial [Lambiella insularis]